MMTHKPFIVITTINEPSEAINHFARWPEWHKVVVGDRKTPANWSHENVTYLSIERQYEEFGDLAKAIPENTYTRKMLGYLYAIRNEATAIFESDDDNIPYQGAAKFLNSAISGEGPLPEGRLSSANGWVNIYKTFGARRCWPRGFPLEFVRDAASEGRPGKDNKPWAVLQLLADEDPDVDAIYRMIDGSPVYFAREKSFILDEGIFCPFNSQATLWLPQAFPLMFLPLGISDRVTDILRGYMALACLWKIRFSVGYSSPILYQKRNKHLLANDFHQELELYSNAASWARALKKLPGNTAQELMASAIAKLVEMKAIEKRNIEVYESFLSHARLQVEK